MATAKKLPSGSWRCQIFDKEETTILPDGTKKIKKIRKSFTVDDPSPRGKRLCEAMAAEWAAEKEKEERKRREITLSKAMDEYIESRTSVCSSRTIMDYKKMKKLYVQDLQKLSVSNITQADVQLAINQESKNLSPKTIKNIHGFVASVLAIYNPSLHLRTTLPKRIKKKTYIPSDDDIKKLLKEAEYSDMEIIIMLGAFCGMRRGEIAALEFSDISGDYISVNKNMVLKADTYDWMIKQPKSYAGYRKIKMPEIVKEKINAIEDKSGRVTSLNPNSITSKFKRHLNNAGIPDFRFHDLRHYSSSVAHLEGIPTMYTRERNGWEDDEMYKNYTHTFNDAYEKMSDKLNNHFDNMLKNK